MSMKSLHFSCGCKYVKGVVQVPTSALPLPMSYCHCSICRHQTGLLAASYAPLPKDRGELIVKGPITSYESSPSMLRHFCSDCGANVYVENSELGEADICTGSLHDSEQYVKLTRNIFVDDNEDGGMSSWLPQIPSWTGNSGQSERVDSRVRSANQPHLADQSSPMEAHCQCRSVHFLIERPNDQSTMPSMFFPDLVVPHVTGDPQNPEDKKWWLRSQGNRWLAGTCACTSCRTYSGFDISTWVFIPRIHILDVQGHPFNLEAMGPLGRHESSDNITRHFCSKCGANVFLSRNSDPDIVDVSAGLLSAEEGARADSWLEWWTERISFEEMAPNQALIANLKDGIKAWAKAMDS